MKNINIFCFGFGQVAKSFIKKLKNEGYKLKISSTSRKKTSKNKFDKIIYNSFFLNNNNFDPKIINEIKKSDYILISIPPSNNTDVVFKNLVFVLRMF